MIYSRNTYQTDNLTIEDFISPLGWDYSLLSNYHNQRGRSKEKSYYLFTVTAIDGTLCEERYHPILGLRIKDKRDGEIGVIESLHKHWLSGYYWTIVYRKEGTRSHGTLFIKNINSIDSVVLESVEDFRKNYQFLDKFNLNSL